MVAVMNSSCPDNEQLEKLIRNRLPAEAAQSLNEHLDGCDDCRQKVQELREDEELTRTLRDAVGLASHHLTQEQLQRCTVGKYEILQEIGHGASGVVFKARDINLEKIVAIKCPRNIDQTDQTDSLAAFVDEARKPARINHPNIPAIYSVCQNDELPYIVMEYVEGKTIIEAVGHLPLDQKLESFLQVLKATAQLHKMNIVHRDLKPGNILCTSTKPTSKPTSKPTITIKVLDFGIADQATLPLNSAVSSFSPVGTPAYISPEQLTGQPSTPSMDVFALGVILFELLTGQQPFTGTTVQQVTDAITHSDPPLPRALNSEIPGPLQAICLMALEKDTKDRYKNGQEFLLDMQRFIKGEPVVANPSLLTDILEHGVENHLNNLSRWQQDRLISTREYDFLADKYDKLRQREEFWVLDSRRLSFSQVILHLGAWICVISAFLMLSFQWEHLGKAARIGLPGLIFVTLIFTGAIVWQRQTRRIGIVLLMAGGLTWPILLATTLRTMDWLEPDSPVVSKVAGEAEAENTVSPDLLKGFLTNDQLLATGFTWLLLSLALWVGTGTTAYSIIFCLSFILAGTAVFSYWEMTVHLHKGHFDIVAGWYLIPAMLLLTLGLILEFKGRIPWLAAPLYIAALILFVATFSIIARFGPTNQWLGLEPHDDAVKYSFIANGIVYLIAGLLADRSRRSRILRKIATFLFWLVPSHVLIPLFMLALAGKGDILWGDWTVSEIALSVGTLVFILASVPKQMKSFFFSGIFYFAVSIIHLTNAHFKDDFAWPVGLAAGGLILTLLAWRYPVLFDRLK
ncbi:MAG: DUF2157 domain-containing protein [Phycisphaerae bacterium]|nr:DUF2157 domain-containing protein [Phycisphaerae bacterium]